MRSIRARDRRGGIGLERRRAAETARAFDRVSGTYDHDWSGLYACARRTCVDQILRAVDGERVHSAVDLALGTGNFYLDLAGHLHIERRYGLDSSQGMLEVARAKLHGGVELIRDTALNAEVHLGTASQDLAMCHFLFSYVDPVDLLPMAHRLLKRGGLLSLATSTRHSLEQLYAGRFHRPGRLLRVREAIERAHTPTDHAGCLALLEQHGFEIVDAALQRQPVVFRSRSDVWAWGLESGWAAAHLGGASGWRRHAARLVFAAAELLLYPLYPVHATSEVSIVLGRAVG